MEPDNQTNTETPGSGNLRERGLVPRPKRTVTVLTLGRLLYGDSDTICRIRNVSPYGMRIDTVSALEEDDSVAIEARSGFRFEGRVVWASRGASGIQFAKALDYDKLLACPSSGSGSALAVRSPRFRVVASARINIEGRYSVVRVIDASLGGCAIASDTLPQKDTEGHLTIPGLPPLEFFTRWKGESCAGLAFRERLGFKDLARWMETPELRFATDPQRAHGGRGGAPVNRFRSS